MMSRKAGSGRREAERRLGALAVVSIAVVSLAVAISCSDLSGSRLPVLSIQFDTLPYPSVVVGDTLRDTTGAIIHPVVHAFDFDGKEIVPAPVFFLSPDSGVTVDSATGIIVADSLRSTPARIVAAVGTLQAVQRVNVTLRPDTILGVNALDSLLYSIVDTTLDVSPLLTIKLSHGTVPNDTAVTSYIVSFAIVSQPEPNLADLVNDGGKVSLVDTTDASGIAGRKIRLHPVALSSATEVDSIIVNATAKYRGVPVSGSPVRLVLLFKPRT
jgi:hypothetical protein